MEKKESKADTAGGMVFVGALIIGIDLDEMISRSLYKIIDVIK